MIVIVEDLTLKKRKKTFQLKGKWMRSELINKNLSLYYWLRGRIGKKGALRVANTVEKMILIFGRERMQ